MATFLQLRQRVSRKLDQPLVTAVGVTDIPEAGVFWTRDDIKEWLNEGYRQLYSEIAEIENLTLIKETDGTYTGSSRSDSLHSLLTITDDPLKIEEVRDATNAGSTGVGTLIPYMHHRQFQAWRIGIENGVGHNNGPSRAWSWYGYDPMRIELYPVPTSSVTLRVRYIPSVPTEMSSDSSKPSAIPTSQHDLLVDYAIIRAREKEEGSSLPSAWNAYMEKVDRFKASVNQRQKQESRQTHRVDLSEYGPSGDGRRY